MYAFISTIIIAVFTLFSAVFTKPLAVLLGAEGGYIPMVCDYVFWYIAFTIPSALSVTLQEFVQNDGVKFEKD